MIKSHGRVVQKRLLFIVLINNNWIIDNIELKRFDYLNQYFECEIQITDPKIVEIGKYLNRSVLRNYRMGGLWIIREINTNKIWIFFMSI